jgi:hypothetical protein
VVLRAQPRAGCVRRPQRRARGLEAGEGVARLGRAWRGVRCVEVRLGVRRRVRRRGVAGRRLRVRRCQVRERARGRRRHAHAQRGDEVRQLPLARDDVVKMGACSLHVMDRIVNHADRRARDTRTIRARPARLHQFGAELREMMLLLAVALIGVLSIVQSWVIAVVLFGAGRLGQLCARALARAGVPLRAFCDGSSRLQGTTVEGAEVLAPAEAARRFPQALFVVAIWTGTARESMLERVAFLRGLGCAHVTSYAPLVWAHGAEEAPFPSFDLPSRTLAAARPSPASWTPSRTGPRCWDSPHPFGPGARREGDWNFARQD